MDGDTSLIERVDTSFHFLFSFSTRRQHTRWTGDWSSDVCSSDLDGTQDDAWADLPRSADTVWGLALSADNSTLYAASPSASTIYEIDVASAMATPFLPGAGDRKSVV